MSKLNPAAFSFVPGQRFTQPQQPTERPEQTEAPPPAPTMTLSIGNKQIPPAATISDPTPSKKAEENSKSTAVKITKADVSASSKTFTTEKAKSDTNTVAQEVKCAADRAVLEDLFGSRLF